MVVFANEPATVVDPKMAVQIGGTALPGIGTAADHDGAADPALRPQGVVGAEVEVRPDGAGVGHGPKTARVGAHPAGTPRARLRRALLREAVVVLFGLLLHLHHRLLGLVALRADPYDLAGVRRQLRPLHGDRGLLLHLILIVSLRRQGMGA